MIGGSFNTPHAETHAILLPHTTSFNSAATDALKPMAASCRDGAIAFVCMDWRHMTELLNAGAQVFSELECLSPRGLGQSLAAVGGGEALAPQTHATPSS